MRNRLLLSILLALAATGVAAIASQDPVSEDFINSATSMSHEIGFAQEVSGQTEYSASSSSIQGEYENINSATTHMQIDETVTSGRVHIGVLSGDGYAWKNPAIEIEEEYIGTYHISQNFTINMDGWLNCCGGSYVIYPPEPVLLSADEVFNCKRCKS